MLRVCRIASIPFLAVIAGCSSPLVEAAKDGRADEVRALLPGDRKRCGLALREAAARNRIDAMAALLDGQCDVNSRDRDGYTPLMMAAIEGNNDAAKLLLARRADAELLTWNDKSAAKLARERRHKDTARLIEAGVPLSAGAPPPEPSPAHRLIFDLFRTTRRAAVSGKAKEQAIAAAAVIKAGKLAVPELTRAARGESVVDDLDPALNGKDIRLTAIKVLGLMGPAAADALPALYAAQASDDSDLHQAAAQALARIARRRR